MVAARRIISTYRHYTDKPARPPVQNPRGVTSRRTKSLADTKSFVDHKSSAAHPDIYEHCGTVNRARHSAAQGTISRAWQNTAQGIKRPPRKGSALSRRVRYGDMPHLSNKVTCCFPLLRACDAPLPRASACGSPYSRRSRYPPDPTFYRPPQVCRAERPRLSLLR